MSFQLFSAAGAWVWDQFGKDITEKAFAGLKEKWREFRWQDAAQKYRERVRALYSTTRILGNPTPIVLKNIFTDVYILDKLTAVRRFDVEQIQEIASRRDGLHLDTERFHALRIVDETDRLLVLGKPGAGKTTFLKYIALLATETDGAVINKIPIFVSLKELVDSGLDLMPFMARQFEICAFPDGETFIKRILESGQAILLFDGLDEVNEGDNQRANLTAKIINFANQYFNCKCLITCRIAATDYAFDQFRYAEVADFDDKQIQSFATNWYKDSETKRDAFLKALYSPENEGLRELGRTPLLLALLCLAFDETMNFPQRHAELYEEALDALLKKWDSSRNIRRDVIYRSLSLGRKRQLLARIAAEEFEKGKYIFKQHELAKFIQEYFEKLPAVDVGGEVEIDGEVILKSIEAQHGIFVERAHRLYSFSHLTFEEYFTARNIVDNASNGALDRLIADHLTDSRWHEVFLLTASLLDNADSFFRSFREAIDNIIRDDENLVKVIRWANVKATTHYARVSSPAVARAVALDIDIDRERARLDANALARANSAIATRDLVRTLNRAVNLTQDLRMTPTYAYLESAENKQRQGRALIIADASALAIALARDLAFSMNLDPTTEITFNDLTSSIRSAIEFSMKTCTLFGFTQLNESLKRLPMLLVEDSLEQWIDFTKQLRSIARNNRLIGEEWKLSREQLDKLRQYNKANLLLINCLKLAYVSDRALIERSLLLPPDRGVHF